MYSRRGDAGEEKGVSPVVGSVETGAGSEQGRGVVAVSERIQTLDARDCAKEALEANIAPYTATR